MNCDASPRLPGLPAIALGALLAILGSAIPARGLAQEAYPSRGITMVVPFPPGSGTDVSARMLARDMGEALGRSVVVENRPGANGSLGAQVVARARPDGYTLLVTYPDPLVLRGLLVKNVPYDPLKDFTPLAGMCEVPLVMMASNAVNARDAAELVRLDRSQPGKIDAASSGNGAFSHLLIEMMNAKTGTRFTHIPFKGEAPAVQHLMGDHGAIIYIGTPPLAIAHQNSGRLKLLAVTTNKRMPQLPEVRTLAEQGFPEFNESFWYGVVISSATPPNIASVLQRHAQQAANQPAVQEQLGRQGCGPLPLSAADFDQRIRSDHAKYTGIARAVGMKVD